MVFLSLVQDAKCLGHYTGRLWWRGSLAHSDFPLMDIDGTPLPHGFSYSCVPLLLADATPVEETAAPLPSPLWRSRCRAGRLSINPSHDDFPALLAEALDVLELSRFQLPEAAERLGISSSQLVRLLRHEPPALARVNATRSELGLRSLR